MNRAFFTANGVIGIGLFVVGWVVQLIGHGFEGRKPAFLDDLVGLLIGPLFVVAEAGFLLGMFGLFSLFQSLDFDRVFSTAAV